MNHRVLATAHAASTSSDMGFELRALLRWQELHGSLRTMREVSVWALAGVALSACGDGEDAAGPGDGAATVTDIDALCGALCGYQERCARERDSADEPCETECLSGAGGNYELFQRRVALALRDCFAALDCNRSDDICIGQVLEQLEIDTATPLAMKCVEVQDECGGFSDEFCLRTVTATAQGRAQIDQCLSASCDAVPQCVEGLSD